MPRRGVLRLLAGAVVAVAVPAAVARPAGAATRRAQGCTEGTTDCWVGPGNPWTCCGGPDTVGGSTICCATKVSATCCESYCTCTTDELGGAKCVCPQCKPGEAECGSGCCQPGSFCASGGPLILCCKNGQTGCGDRCCDANEECFRAGAGRARIEVCVARCPKGRARCGEGRCCPKGQRCVNPKKGTCSPCREGQQGCGKKCCPQGSSCCDPAVGLCCKRKTETCSGFGETAICCPKGRDVCESAPGSRKPVCCEKGRTCASVADETGTIPAANAGKKTCCPPERTVKVGGAVTCCPEGYRSLGGKLVVPAGDAGGLCCREDLLCGSAADPICCASGSFAPELAQACCGGACVSLRNDPRNCGACGNVCPSGQCVDGLCVFA